MSELINDLPFLDYAARPGMNATAIKAGRLSMLAMHHAIKGPGKQDTAALAWGRVVHAAILEPERVLARIVVWEGGRKAGKEWAAFIEAHEGYEIVTADERTDLEATVLSVRRNATARRLIEQSAHEVSAFWTDPVIGQCKARLDGWSEKNGVLEVKTTGRIEQRAFGRQFFDLGYDLQVGWYAAGAFSYNPPGRDPVRLIAVQSSAPWDCYVVEMPAHVVEDGYQAAYEIAARYRACQACGVYPGVSGGEDVVPLEIPAWIGADKPAVVPAESMEASEL